MSFKIGVIGYSTTPFDVELATGILQSILDFVVLSCKQNYPNKELVIVSGLTNFGIPKLAYEYAATHGLKTAGIACALAKSHECYPVDDIKIVGEEWGDESMTFLKSIDMLIRIGGSEQSIDEAKLFSVLFPLEPMYEVDL